MYSKELRLHISLMLWTLNTDAAKELGYVLESFGLTAFAKDIYYECYLLTADWGCAFHYMLAVPTLSLSSTHAERSFRRLLSNLHQVTNAAQSTGIISLELRLRRFMCESGTIDQSLMVRDFPGCGSSPLEMQPLREDAVLHALPINPQYLGSPPAMVYRLVGQLFEEMMHSSSLPDPRPLARRDTLRVGIVSGKDFDCHPTHRCLSLVSCLLVPLESLGNTSPGLCFQYIAEYLAGRDGRPLLQVVFFDRPHLVTVFAESMRRIAAEVLLLDPTNVSSSRSMIAAAKVDLLIYLSLSTEKFAYLLGQTRSD